MHRDSYSHRQRQFWAQRLLFRRSDTKGAQSIAGTLRAMNAYRRIICTRRLLGHCHADCCRHVIRAEFKRAHNRCASQSSIGRGGAAGRANGDLGGIASRYVVLPRLAITQIDAAEVRHMGPLLDPNDLLTSWRSGDW